MAKSSAGLTAHRADAAYSSIFHSVLMACVIQIESTDA
jgi:hypothetical protein